MGPRRRDAGRLLAVLLLVVVAAYGASRATAHAGAGAPAGSGRAATLVHATTLGASASPAPAVRTVAMPGHRAYLLLAKAASGPLPLVVLLHGTNVAASTEMTATGFAALARADRVLLVAPESVGPTWDSGDGCCGQPAAEHLDDTAFVTSVIADVRRRADVDPHRVYLVGYSAGGKLSYDVACALPHTFAATATYGAGPQLPCADAVPRPVFVGYGEQDTLEPIAGKPHNDRGLHQPAATTVGQLRALDGCAPTPSVSRVGPATIEAWVDCAPGAAVDYVRWAGQTHTFPAGPQVPADATAATLMWRFFTEHVRGATVDAGGAVAAPVRAGTRA